MKPLVIVLELVFYMFKFIKNWIWSFIFKTFERLGSNSVLAFTNQK